MGITQQACTCEQLSWLPYAVWQMLQDCLLGIEGAIRAPMKQVVAAVPCLVSQEH
jgi:hypothetical protein